MLSWAERDSDSTATVRPGQLDPAHLEWFHAELAEVWRPFAQRFVALAAGEIAGDRLTLPLLTH